MAFLSSLNIPLSGMTAERFRLDIISQNVSHADDVATTPEDVFKRQMVVFGEDRAFKDTLAQKMAEGEYIPNIFRYVQMRGVEAVEVVEDETPPEPVYSPDHPLADEYGYIYESNVDRQVEIIDAMQAANSFNACKSMYEALQGVIQASLNIGK